MSLRHAGHGGGEGRGEGAGRGGIDALLRWLGGRLTEHGERDVVAATARALRRDTAAVRDSLRVEQQLLRQTGRDSVAIVATLRDILDRARSSSAGAVDHVRGEARRARTLLDAQHDHEVASARATARLELGEELPAGPGTPEQEADRVRERLNTLVADACRSWFTRVGKEVDSALRGAADRVLTRLRDDLTQARRSAEQTLHIRLSDVDELPAPSQPRLPNLDIGQEIAWHELITTTIARHLPATVRRRRLHHHLTAWADTALPKPFGRARANLQDWLRATTREIERTLSATWDHQLAALQRGIEEATWHWDHTDTQLTGRRELLVEHLTTVDGALRELDHLTTELSQPPTAEPGGA